MKNKYLIIATTAFSFFAGISNNVQAQDPTLSFGKYLTQTSWLVGFGLDIVDNNEDRNPFKVMNRGGKYKGGSPAFNTPFKFTVEKDIYGFRHWKYTKGLSLLGAVSSTSLRPHNFGAVDVYLKYKLNTLWGEKLYGSYRIFDPYVLVGAGYSYMDYNHPNYGPHAHRDKTKPRIDKDNFLNLNAGLGINLWIFPNVAINLQSVGKYGMLAKVWDGTNYFQNSVGLIFKIGRCNNTKVELVDFFIPLKTDLLKFAPLVDNDTLNTPAINLTSSAKPDTATIPNDKIIEVKLDTASVADREIRNSSNLKFHLVTGCFRIETNAINFVISLKNKNIQASIIGKRGRLYVVSAGDYATRQEALNNLAQLRVNYPDTWLLKK